MDTTRPRQFDSSDVARAWDLGAEAWDDFVESGADYYRLEVHGPALMEVCGDVREMRVLDLGCGQGYFSRQLALRGAHVIAVDISEKQLENARWHEERSPLGINYLVMDAARVDEVWPEGYFDLVTACMAMQDMPEPAKTLKSARRVLKRGGRMVFSIPHPATDTPFRQWDRDGTGAKLALKIDRYFESGPVITRWNMERLRSQWETPHWHWTLSQWSEMIEGAGFLVRRLHEPRAAAEQVQRLPELEDCHRLPYFLVFDLVPKA